MSVKDCGSCHNIQRRVATSFPAVRGPDETNELRGDLDRIHDQHFITEPVYVQKRVIIGRVKGRVKGRKKRQPDEDVVVTYWSANSYPNYSLGLDTMERKYVAHTLDRFFGAPLYLDNVQYEI